MLDTDDLGGIFCKDTDNLGKICVRYNLQYANLKLPFLFLLFSTNLLNFKLPFFLCFQTSDGWNTKENLQHYQEEVGLPSLNLRKLGLCLSMAGPGQPPR